MASRKAGGRKPSQKNINSAFAGCRNRQNKSSFAPGFAENTHILKKKVGPTITTICQQRIQTYNSKPQHTPKKKCMHWVSVNELGKRQVSRRNFRKATPALVLELLKQIFDSLPEDHDGFKIDGSDTLFSASSLSGFCEDIAILQEILTRQLNERDHIHITTLVSSLETVIVDDGASIDPTGAIDAVTGINGSDDEVDDVGVVESNFASALFNNVSLAVDMTAASEQPQQPQQLPFEQYSSASSSEPIVKMVEVDVETDPMVQEQEQEQADQTQPQNPFLFDGLGESPERFHANNTSTEDSREYGGDAVEESEDGRKRKSVDTHIMPTNISEALIHVSALECPRSEHFLQTYWKQVPHEDSLLAKMLGADYVNQFTEIPGATNTIEGWGSSCAHSLSVADPPLLRDYHEIEEIKPKTKPRKGNLCGTSVSGGGATAVDYVDPSDPDAAVLLAARERYLSSKKKSRIYHFVQPVSSTQFQQSMQQLQICQPYNVVVHPQAQLVADVHAHLCKHEVIGSLAGRYDAGSNTLHIMAAIPCRPETNQNDPHLSVEAMPVALLDIQEYARNTLKLDTVGWYHSHTTFCGDPSNIDVGIQADRQKSMKGHPFIGLIVCAYGPQALGQDQSSSMPVTNHTYFTTTAIAYSMQSEEGTWSMETLVDIPVRMKVNMMDISSPSSVVQAHDENARNSRIMNIMKQSDEYQFYSGSSSGDSGGLMCSLEPFVGAFSFAGNVDTNAGEPTANCYCCVNKTVKRLQEHDYFKTSLLCLRASQQPTKMKSKKSNALSLESSTLTPPPGCFLHILQGMDSTCGELRDFIEQAPLGMQFASAIIVMLFVQYSSQENRVTLEDICTVSNEKMTKHVKLVRSAADCLRAGFGLPASEIDAWIKQLDSLLTRTWNFNFPLLLDNPDSAPTQSETQTAPRRSARHSVASTNLEQLSTGVSGVLV